MLCIAHRSSRVLSAREPRPLHRTLLPSPPFFASQHGFYVRCCRHRRFLSTTAYPSKRSIHNKTKKERELPRPASVHFRMFCVRQMLHVCHASPVYCIARLLRRSLSSTLYFIHHRISVKKVKSQQNQKRESCPVTLFTCQPTSASSPAISLLTLSLYLPFSSLIFTYLILA